MGPRHEGGVIRGRGHQRVSNKCSKCEISVTTHRLCLYHIYQDPTQLCQFTSLSAGLHHMSHQTSAADFCELSHATPAVANGGAKTKFCTTNVEPPTPHPERASSNQGKQTAALRWRCSSYWCCDSSSISLPIGVVPALAAATASASLPQQHQ